MNIDGYISLKQYTTIRSNDYITTFTFSLGEDKKILTERRMPHFYGVTALQSHNILIICRHHLPSGVSLACPQDSFRPQSTRMGHYSHLQFIFLSKGRKCE